MRLKSKFISVFTILMLLFTIIFTGFTYSEGAKKIAYIENDPYFNYTGTFYGILKGLDGLELIDVVNSLDFQIGDEDSKLIWDVISKRPSENIEFVEDGFFRLLMQSEDEQAQMMKRIEAGEFDLILVMGTKAGKFAAANIKNTPVMVFSTSNAVGAGIVDSPEDSGQDNLWAHVDTTRYYRQLDVFYDTFKFDKLGVVFEDTKSGRDLAAIPTIYKFAEENNFEVVEKYVSEAESEEDQARYDREIKAAYKEISKEVDAIYLTPGSRDTKKTYDYLESFYSENIPVFSQVGNLEVERGALFSVYRFNYDEIGAFGASQARSVMEGENIRELEQEFGETPSISINIEVARIIDYKFSIDVLLVTDKMFPKIIKE